jgi:HAD superfamily hydrolase (TIGR01509 family)
VTGNGPLGLIIFDCDGVLVDSEPLVCGIVAEEFSRHGFTITANEVMARFMGRPQREIVAEMEAQWGRPVPDAFHSGCKARVAAAYGSDLAAIPDVAATLDGLTIPFCVASSAYPEKLTLGLRATGLYERLAPNIISASWVSQGKPAPDVFIYAAGWMRRPAAECLVVEDSVPGVTAARAAGMRAIGFAGGSHCGPDHGARLLAAGAEAVFVRMPDLARLVPQAFR